MDKIVSIFKTNTNILKVMYSSVFYIRRQNYSKGLLYSAQCSDMLINVIEQLIKNESLLSQHGISINNEYIITSLTNLKDAQERGDYILLADIYDSVLMPMITSIQEAIIAKTDGYEELLMRENTTQAVSKRYKVEPTSQGLATMYWINREGEHIYLHTNINPTLEALSVANEWYNGEKYHYVVYGLGLGYEIFELIKLSNAIEVDVYESSQDIIDMAKCYGVLEEISKSGQVKIHCDSNFSKIAACNLDGEYTEFVARMTSIKTIEDDIKREWFENLFTYKMATQNQGMTMLRSFVENEKINAEPVENIMGELKDKDIYVIAAGPSLDKNMNELKNVGEKGVIIATGTVYKKLLSKNIKPDYVVIIDANPTTFTQISGVENCGVPLIFLSTAYYKTVNAYNGKKYIAYQNGYAKAEDCANNNGCMLFNTGGSVTTLAIDIALQAGCAKLICVGLDLALTGGVDHASGTTYINKINENEGIYRKVEAVGGGYVNTTKGYDVFRNWIENRISKVKDIEIIDATEGGARIKGMRIERLKDVVKM